MKRFISVLLATAFLCANGATVFAEEKTELGLNGEAISVEEKNEAELDFEEAQRLGENIEAEENDEIVEVELTANSDDSTVIKYAVEGGNIFFDTATGTVTDAEESITKVILPEMIEGVDVVAIKDNAFYGAKVEEIYIPETVEAIGDYALTNNTKIKTITVAESNEKFVSIDNVIYSKDMTTLVAYAPFKEDTTFEIPSTVIEMVRGCFFDAANLTEVKVPEGLIELPACAFYECSSLTKVDLPNTIEEIGGSCFKGCSNLTTIDLPDNLEIINSNVFENCSSLTEITVPKYVRHIGGENFIGCSSLKEIKVEEGNTYFKAIDGVLYRLGSEGKPVTLIKYPETKTNDTFEIPNTVYMLYAKSFANATNLKKVTIPSSVTQIYEKAFENTGLTEVEIPNTVTKLDYGIFVKCAQLKKANIQANCKTLEALMFSNCSQLESVIIGDSFTKLNRQTFNNCGALKEVTLPSQLVDLEGSNFEGCLALEEITIPSTVTNIGYNCFYECDKLKEIVIPSGVTKIANSTFYKCHSLTKVELPDTITDIGNYAFDHCLNLDIQIPPNVKTIGDLAYRYNDSPAEITLPKTLESIGTQVFRGCNGLTKIIVEEGNPYFTADEEGVLFTKDMSTLVMYPTGRYDDYTVPEAVKNIKECGFYNSRVKTVTLPEGLETIENNVFTYCSYIKPILLPKSLTYIHPLAFYTESGVIRLLCYDGTYALEYLKTNQYSYSYEIIYDKTEDNFIFNEQGDTIIGYTGNNTVAFVPVRENVTTIGENAFTGTCLIKLIIRDNIKSIADNAFEGLEEQITIYCEVGSEAERLAKAKGLKIAYLGDANLDDKVDANDGEKMLEFVRNRDLDRKIPDRITFVLDDEEEITATTAVKIMQLAEKA